MNANVPVICDCICRWWLNRFKCIVVQESFFFGAHTTRLYKPKCTKESKWKWNGKKINDLIMTKKKKSICTNNVACVTNEWTRIIWIIEWKKWSLESRWQSKQSTAHIWIETVINQMKRMTHCSSRWWEWNAVYFPIKTSISFDFVFNACQYLIWLMLFGIIVFA